MTTINGKDYYEAIDVILGGTPCQGFSVAGKKKGLDDERSGLAWHFVRLVSEIRPRWMVWENVPGCFSCWSDEENREQESDCGSCAVSGHEAAHCVEDVLQSNDFAAFTSALVECGYNLSYRVLDAQYFGVPQRRRRIFVVGHIADWQHSAAVLFERPCMSGNPPKSGKAGENIARTFEVGPGGGKQSNVSHTLDCQSKNGPMQNQVSTAIVEPLTTRPYSDRGAADESKLVVGTYRMTDFGGYKSSSSSSTLKQRDYKDATDLICVSSRQDPDTVENLSLPLDANLPVHTIAFAQNQRNEIREMSIAGALAAEPGMKQQTFLNQGMSVRRLTPLECERLQGFPDNWTNIPYGRPTGPDVLCPDSHRYKAAGNSIAVLVLEWIGKRIEMVEQLEKHND
jgi:DNA (cytosine-5)-methyltransferase 1